MPLWYHGTIWHFSFSERLVAINNQEQRRSAVAWASWGSLQPFVHTRCHMFVSHKVGLCLFFGPHSLPDTNLSFHWGRNSLNILQNNKTVKLQCPTSDTYPISYVLCHIFSECVRPSRVSPASMTPDNLLFLFPPMDQDRGTQSPAPVQTLPLVLLYGWIVRWLTKSSVLNIFWVMFSMFSLVLLSHIFLVVEVLISFE